MNFSQDDNVEVFSAMNISDSIQLRKNSKEDFYNSTIMKYKTHYPKILGEKNAGSGYDEKYVDKQTMLHGNNSNNNFSNYSKLWFLRFGKLFKV